MVYQSRLVAMASLTSERPENTFSSLLLFWAHCSPHWIIGWLSHWSQLDWTRRLEWRDWLYSGDGGMGLRERPWLDWGLRGEEILGLWEWRDIALVVLNQINSGPMTRPCGTSQDSGWVTNPESLAWPLSKATYEDLIKATQLRFSCWGWQVRNNQCKVFKRWLNLRRFK